MNTCAWKLKDLLRTFSAQELGVKDLLPAYLDPNLKTEDLLTGVSFASGGSGYDPLTPKIVVIIKSLLIFKLINEFPFLKRQ